MTLAGWGARPYKLAPRCRYQAQDSPQTLVEALAEYYEVNRGGVYQPATVSAESTALFRNHDICHVIFGLDTTMADEILADWRTRLASDVGGARYAAFFDECPEVRPVFKRVGYATIALATLREQRRIALAIAEASRMPKPWPWSPPASFQDRTLGSLRGEFGIRIV